MTMRSATSLVTRQHATAAAAAGMSLKVWVGYLYQEPLDQWHAGVGALETPPSLVPHSFLGTSLHNFA